MIKLTFACIGSVAAFALFVHSAASGEGFTGFSVTLVAVFVASTICERLAKGGQAL